MTHTHTYTQKYNPLKHKTHKNKITGNDLGIQDGWHNIQVYGTPNEIGFAHGYLLATHISECIQLMKYTIQTSGYTVEQYYNIAKEQIHPIIESVYPYLFEEMKSISNGANYKLRQYRKTRSSKKQYKHITYEDILTWNSYLSIDSINFPSKQQRCSAFIATGDATATGEIVMGHNTHYNYEFAHLSNIMMSVAPDKGHGFIMQTMPGLICSSMDWFLCTSGIIGCETTINTKASELQHGRPYFGRIRECMQFGNTLEDYARIITTDRSNDYNCNWMFGNIHTNEIMICELSETDAFVETKISGIYYASNNPVDKNIKYKSSVYYTTESNPTDNRAERLEYLLEDKYVGKLNLSNAKKILTDHYDSYLGKIEKSPRTVCRHNEFETNSPSGTIDCKVVNTRMAKKLMFWGKFGPPCGTPFIKTHHQFKNPYLKNILPHKWTVLQSNV